MKRWGRSQALKEQIDESDNQTSKLTDLSLYIYIAHKKICSVILYYFESNSLSQAQC